MKQNYLKGLAENQRVIYILRTILIVLCASAVCIVLNRSGVMKENILMVFLIGVLLTGMFTNGYEYGIISAIASVLMFNYFFTVPVHTFAIMNPDDVVLMAFFLIVSCISSGMTARFRKQVLRAEENEKAARRMAEMSEKFINVTGRENIIRRGLKFVQENTGYTCSVELPDEEENREPGEYGGYILFPIGGIVRKIGELKVYNGERGISAEQEVFIRAAASQMGIALDRERIYAEQEKTRLDMEKEHLKSSMLRSISHDFRTPLTGIIGDCDLILGKNAIGEKEQLMLVKDIREQSLWLTRMMENILSMTRIENRVDFIEKNQEVVEELIYEAERHIAGLKERRRFSHVIPQELITAQVDGKLIIQVIVNLLDNALKHTSEGGVISLRANYRDGRVYVIVEDDGNGIRPGMEEKIFEEFVSFSEHEADHKRGIGLGLAICKEVIEAHGGKIWAENRSEGGARFTFWLKAEKVGE